MDDILTLIENDGGNIVCTNYFQSRAAQAGYIFVSVNAGTFRLLVPDGILPSLLKEIAHADEVIVSRGPLSIPATNAAYTAWPGTGDGDGLEFLFEDGTKRPFCIHLGLNQVDLVPSDNQRDRKGQPHRWRCTIWNERMERVADFPCRYRLAKRLPCLKRWYD